MTGPLTYYVYALKDPRQSPAPPYYIGKGTGNRAQQHLLEADSGSEKDRVTQEIRDGGREPIVEVLVSDLEEHQALRIEAELIAAFGVRASGGMLTNVVVPKGTAGGTRPVTVPTGAYETAQIGLDLLLRTVLNVVRANPEKGVTNADLVHTLGLGSDHGGASKDYLTYSLLGILMREDRIVKSGSRYYPPGGASR